MTPAKLNALLKVKPEPGKLRDHIKVLHKALDEEQDEDTRARIKLAVNEAEPDVEVGK